MKQAMKNKLGGNRMSAHMKALRSKHKKAGGGKKPTLQKHPQVAGRGKGSMGRY